MHFHGIIYNVKEIKTSFPIRLYGEKEVYRMKKFEIWAIFDNGMSVKVETHKTEQNARKAIDAMNCKNQYEMSIGYGFPYGLPTYVIR